MKDAIRSRLLKAALAIAMGVKMRNQYLGNMGNGWR